MNEPVAKDDIERISMQVLRGSRGLDVFPTPIERIVNYAELVVNGNVDISRVHPSYMDRANEFLRSAIAKVRGIFDIRKRVIYLDLSQNANRKNFVTLHETAHGILPWQRSVHQIIGDNDYTLSLDQTEEFELEANYFASITLFQQDRFLNELSKLGLGIDSAMHLANYFGASVHAALRRYVDCSKNRCALIILEGLDRSTGTCTARNFLPSSSFITSFADVIIPKVLDVSWPFVQDYLARRRFKKDGRLTYRAEEGDIEFTYQFFNNTYNAFALLYPVGEVNKTRVTFAMGGEGRENAPTSNSTQHDQLVEVALRERKGDFPRP